MSYEQTRNTNDRSTQARRNLLRRVEAGEIDAALLDELEGWLLDAEMVGRDRERDKAYSAYYRTKNRRPTRTTRPIPPTSSDALSLLKRREEIDTKLVSTNVDTRLAQPDDPRTTLFREGLGTLMRITGKTESSSRSLIGRWLKSVDDEAIHVQGAIEDAARERVADPVPWITKSLQKHGRNINGANGRPKSSKEEWGELLQSLGSGEFLESFINGVPQRESGRSEGVSRNGGGGFHGLPIRIGQAGGDAVGNSNGSSDLFANGGRNQQLADEET